MTSLKMKKVLIMGLITAALAAGLYGFAWLRDNLGGEEVMVAGEAVGVAREVAVPALLYHGIVAEADGTNVTVEDFRAQMAALAEAGYAAIDTHDLLAFYTEGTLLPPKPVVITFDDGRRDSYINGGPILAQHGFKAVMFVVTAKQESGEAGFLSWEELEQMHASGLWDIEAHGYNYHRMIPIDGSGGTGLFACNKMWIEGEGRLETDDEYRDRLLGDLRKVKSDLESRLEGAEVVSFAFPFGDFGQQSVNMEQEAAREAIVTAVNTVYPLSFELNSSGGDFANHEDSGHDLLKRLVVSSDTTAGELVKLLEGTQPKMLPYARIGFTGDDLFSICGTWGNVGLEEGRLVLSAAADGTGALALFNGSHYWRDYEAEAEIRIEAGDNAYLVGRYVDNANYVFCEVDGKSVTLAQKVAGENAILAAAEYAKNPAQYRVALRFEGGSVSCRVDDTVLFGPVALDPSLARGDVGFKVWDPRAGLVKASVGRIVVLPALPDGAQRMETPR